jgi:hypothetical protein
MTATTAPSKTTRTRKVLQQIDVPAPEAPAAPEAAAEAAPQLSAVEKRRAYQKASRERRKALEAACGITSRKGYETPDGATFPTLKAARRHLAWTRFLDHAHSSEGQLLFSNAGTTLEVPGAALALWLECNRAQVQEFLKSVKP